MTIRNRFLLAGFAAAAVVWLVLSGVTAAKKPATREQVSVVAIEVPVNVTKGGKPVRGLTVDQFELLDDGKPQKILGMTVLDTYQYGCTPYTELVVCSLQFQGPP